jgi:hypothetical protein
MCVCFTCIFSNKLDVFKATCSIAVYKAVALGSVSNQFRPTKLVAGFFGA